MLTPAFEIGQDDECVTVYIKVPYAQISETDTYYDDNYFSFYCKPYYLRIILPEKVVSCEEPPVSYDFDEGVFTIRMKKLVPGQYFEGLDLLTKLLAPRGKPKASPPLIEVLGDSSGKEDDDDDEFCDWEIEQTAVKYDNVAHLLESSKCGFGNLYSCAVFKLEEEAKVIFEITDPSTKLPLVRLEERVAAEVKAFSDDHYLADLYEDDDIQMVLSFHPDWENLHEQMKSENLENADDIVKFSSEEKERMRSLPNKEYLLEKSEKKILSLGIIDILFGYAYNKRTTSGENTCESGWTINKLSATLSCLESFKTIQSVAQTCVQRSLCYPLYRHWELALMVLQDVVKIVTLGRKYILKCFLEIHEIFCNSAPRYILNDLYITDYCIWIQSKSCKTKMLMSLAESLKEVEITKEHLDLEIVELELVAKCHIFNLIQSSDGEHSVGTTSEGDEDHKSFLSNSASCPDVMSDAETLLLYLKGLNIGDSAELDIPSIELSTKDSNSGVPPISLDLLQIDSDSSSSKDENSSDSCSSTSWETDSDDCSSSSDVDSDSDSSSSEDSNECFGLLKKDGCSERRR